MIRSNKSQENKDNCLAESLATQGVPLAPKLRAEMETRFCRDFGHVRIHTGDAAAALADAHCAEAYTCGSDIVFAKGRFAPETERGMWLLAHELSHVVQQSRGTSVSLKPESESARDILELQADRVADLIASGKALPADFAFHDAPAHTIQCHVGPVCPGVSIGAGDRAIWLAANEAIEMAYKYDPKTGPANALFFGSQFETGRDVLPPAGVPNRKFAEKLLRKLRGLVNQRRPDIIDFQLQTMYEIKTVGNERDGMVQLESYYTVAEKICREYSVPPWKAEYATWYPPHVLPFPTDTLRKVVCTQATDHKRYPALILYDVRLLNDEERRRRRMRKVNEKQLEDYEPQFNELFPRIKSEMKDKLREFDPENPEYVIIVPKKFYLDWQKIQSDKMIDKMRVKLPPFLDTRHPIGQFRTIGWTLVGLTAAAYAGLYIIAGVSLLAPAAAAGGATAAGGGAASGGATIIPLFKAGTAAAATEELVKAASVLIVIGAISDANAESLTVNEVSAIRVVPVSDFSPRNGVQSAVSERSPLRSSFEVCQDTAGKFNVHTEVLFDGEPHYIIARFIAK